MYASAFIEGTGGQNSSQLIESLWAALKPERSEPLVSFYLSAMNHFSNWHSKWR